MRLVRYRDRESGDTAVYSEQQDGTLSRLGVENFSALLGLPVPALRELLAAARAWPMTADQMEILAPCDGRMEVWAAGVTYLSSRDARMEESTEASVYDRVYDAHRPELFFKSVPWRVVTNDDPIGVRADSTLNVPEPELALVINSRAELVGYTVCNDVSSRSIEGENPLYLPQAKVYTASCAVAGAVRPVWEVADPLALDIRVEIWRNDELLWSDFTSTARLKRRFSDLISWLFAAQSFPDGVILSTGTSLVPSMDIDLQAGDRVFIAIDEVGDLSNPVISVGSRDLESWQS